MKIVTVFIPCYLAHRLLILIIFSLLSILWTPFISHAAPPSFPSEIKEIRAPSGLYSATWKRGDFKKEKPHQLFLKKLSNGRAVKILEFYRSVNVLWSPNGRFVAVTDWTGSNVSQVLLFRPGKKKVINLANSLHHSLGEQPDMSNSVHIYFEAIRWQDNGKLLFKVFGDRTDNHASGLRHFEHYFEFDVSGVVAEIKLRWKNP